MQIRYLQIHQTRKHAPTSYEDLLGDAIERAFAAGIQDLSALTRALNDSGLATPSGFAWTEDLYCKEIAALAN